MVLPHHRRVQQRGGRRKRINRGVKPLTCQRAAKHDHAIHVARNGGDGGIGEIIGGHIDRLNGCDRRPRDGCDTFLQPCHFGRQCRLIAHARRQAAQQAGHLCPRLHKAKDVVHQQQHVLMFCIAEIFRYGQRSQGRAPACAWRFVHLAINQHSARQHARVRHFRQQLMPFA